MSGEEPTIQIKACYDLSDPEQKAKFYEAIGAEEEEMDVNDIKTLYGIPTGEGTDQKIYKVKIINIPYEDLDPGDIDDLITRDPGEYEKWCGRQEYNETQSKLPIPRKKYAIFKRLQHKIFYYNSSFPEYLTEANIRKKLTELYATHAILKRR